MRRFARWLEQDRIDVHALEGPLRQPAFAVGGRPRRSLALETASWWHPDGVVRRSRVSRGRAGPLVWNVLAPPRRRVASDRAQAGLDRVAALLPGRWPVVLTAERGVADTHRRDHRARVGWPWRMRINGRLWRYRDGTRGGTVQRMPWSPGTARVGPGVDRTTPRDGPGHRAMARGHAGKDSWVVVSEAPTAVQTCDASGWRGARDAHGVADHSHGVPRESSLIRSAAAWARRCVVRAIPTRSLGAHGTAVVPHGKRRWGDPPGFRGQR